MTVNDLIERLQKCDPDATVRIVTNAGDYGIKSVELYDAITIGIMSDEPQEYEGYGE